MWLRSLKKNFKPKLKTGGGWSSLFGETVFSLLERGLRLSSHGFRRVSFFPPAKSFLCSLSGSLVSPVWNSLAFGWYAVCGANENIGHDFFRWPVADIGIGHNGYWATCETDGNGFNGPWSLVPHTSLHAPMLSVRGGNSSRLLFSLPPGTSLPPCVFPRTETQATWLGFSAGLLWH